MSTARRLPYLAKQWGAVLALGVSIAISIVSVMINIIQLFDNRSSLIVKEHYISELNEVNVNIVNLKKQINDQRQVIAGADYERNKSEAYIVSIERLKSELSADQDELASAQARQHEIEAKLSCR
jgi:hypothetical protein